MNHFGAHCVNDEVWAIEVEGTNTDMYRYVNEGGYQYWETKSKKIHDQVYHCVTIEFGQYLFCIGGDHYSYNNNARWSNRHGRRETYRYDTLADSWSTRANMAYARTGHSECSPYEPHTTPTAPPLALPELSHHGLPQPA